MQAAGPCPSAGCSEGPDKEGRGDECSLHTHVPQYAFFPLPFLISSHSTTVFCWVTTLEHTWSSYISRCTCPQWGVQSSGDVERHTLGGWGRRSTIQEISRTSQEESREQEEARFSLHQQRVMGRQPKHLQMSSRQPGKLP